MVHFTLHMSSCVQFTPGVWLCVCVSASLYNVSLTLSNQWLLILFILEAHLKWTGILEYEQERIDLVYFNKIKKNVFPGHLKAKCLCKNKIKKKFTAVTFCLPYTFPWSPSLCDERHLTQKSVLQSLSPTSSKMSIFSFPTAVLLNS